MIRFFGSNVMFCKGGLSLETMGFGEEVGKNGTLLLQAGIMVYHSVG